MPSPTRELLQSSIAAHRRGDVEQPNAATFAGLVLEGFEGDVRRAQAILAVAATYLATIALEEGR